MSECCCSLHSPAKKALQEKMFEKIIEKNRHEWEIWGQCIFDSSRSGVLRIFLKVLEQGVF